MTTGTTATEAHPTAAELEAFLELDLAPSRERAMRDHLADCRSCAATAVAREPALIAAALPRRTLRESDWAPMMQSLMATVESDLKARARPPLGERLLRWLKWPPALPAGLVPAGAVAAALVVALLAPVFGPPGGNAPQIAGARLQPALADAVPADSAPGDFVLLSNPQARVTHLLVSGGGDAAPVQLTMVVDESLADLF